MRGILYIGLLILLCVNVSAETFSGYGSCYGNFIILNGRAEGSYNFTGVTNVLDDVSNVNIYQTQCRINPDLPRELNQTTGCECDFLTPLNPCANWTTPVIKDPWNWNLTEAKRLSHEILVHGSEVDYFRTIIHLSDQISGVLYNNTYETPANTPINLNDNNLTGTEYNLTFLKEEDGLGFPFTDHNVSYVDVLCDYGTLRFNLNDSLQDFSVMLDSSQSIRFEITTDSGGSFRSFIPDYGANNIYLIDGSSLKYRFDLADNTGRCTDSSIHFQTSVNGSLVDVYDNYWGVENEVYISLVNDTPYKVYLVCTDQSVRDYGFMSFDYSDLTKTVYVNNVDYEDFIDQYSGGLSTSFTQDYDSGVFSFVYQKDSGTVDSINMSVYLQNISHPGYLMDSTLVEDSPEGSLTYTCSNKSASYYATIDIINDGKRIPKAVAFILRNKSTYLYHFGIGDPDDTLMGVQVSTVYKWLGFLMVGGVVLAFSPIHAGIGAIAGVGLAVVIDFIGWFDVNWGVMTLAFIFAISIHLTLRRSWS